jgi:sugar/nucleoside kinase (ribokinase family)
MSIDVLGLGAVAMDMVLTCDHLPNEDGYAVIQTETLMPGGSCANVLVTLSGLGAKPGLVSQLGNDTVGRKLLDDLQSSDVETRYVSIKNGGISMHTYVAVDRNGEKTIFCNMGDSLLTLSETDVHAAMLDGVKVFYTDMQPAAPALKLARLCREREIPVIYNLQVEPAFLNQCGITTPLIEEMLSLCSLLVTFKEGVIQQTGNGDLMTAAASLYDRYRPELGIIVTLGKGGAVWVDGNDGLSVPAFCVEARDTTGAGDAFIGGLIHAMFFEKCDQRTSITFATACAALKCLQPGPRVSVSKTGVWRFIQGYGK